MFKFKKKVRDNAQSGINQVNKASGGKQSVKGGININIDSDTSNDEFDKGALLRGFERIWNKLEVIEKQGDENKEDNAKIKEALLIYVVNNGVEQKVKDIVKTILQN